uniref:Uncharacterized protein n=1 Tax=Anopheles atroparvus TaxID=41427 RepID=A0A182J8Q8_ANOAO
MKSLPALVAFALLATVCASPSPFFHKHSVHKQRYAYYPVSVQRYVHVPEVHVQKLLYPAPVYVAPEYHVAARSAVVQTVAGGSVNVAANPGAIHVTKTNPTVVTVA